MAGGWTLIGYTAPNDGSTTNFVYGIGDIALDNSTEVTAATVGWQAANLKDLNDCKAGAGTAKQKLTTARWTVEVVGTSTSLTFDSEADGAGCVALTPTFANIGK